ncbi:GNAT family N-acetyltransferase [Litoribacterium kuwaitense]|uniref:GNAT family N-acetyltransferase n=1 Tax=Litoribacterium kuwaitense TaxID=1398745 RepID=UPI00248374C6|nr:GNAT family N-acetyltransferase [Litoribacterium kuwaitense]
MTICADDIDIRPLQTVDIPKMSKWLQNPSLLQYYEGRDRPHDESLVQHRFFRKEKTKRRFIILFRHEPIGYCQVYQLEMI